MLDHSRSVFNNNCLRVPRNPRSDQPLPVYEQKFLNEFNNKNFEMKGKNSTENTTAVKSFIDFYDSIPEYDDVNHLSNREFYKKLQNLKEKQKLYCDYLRNQIRFDNKDTEWIEDYKNLSLEDNKSVKEKKRKPTIKSFCTTPILNKTGVSKTMEDVESLNFSDKEILKPPSRRSVRIETPSEKDLTPDFTPESNLRPKSRANISSADSKRMYEWEDLSFEDFRELSSNNSPLPLETKSAPNTPTKTKKNVDKSEENDGITIPKPFQMTVRDEENKIVEELFLKVNKPSNEDKPEMFKAHDIPIESQIPLFDKIMADQERRSHIVKEKRKAALQAQMKPFSFTKRDEEIQALTKRLSKSVPCIYYDEPPLKIKKFKAKPIPRNLFSNYIYKKMHEDEFYRALQKKIRAEEMLRAASLPPSMAKREKSQPKFDVCPRSYRDLHLEDKEAPKRPKKIPNYKAYHDQIERELEELKNEFISTSPRPFKLKTSKRGEKKSKKKYCRNFSASSKSSSDTRTTSSLDVPCINRSNLAAVLRISSARTKNDFRQRLEMEMVRKLEEAKLKEEARWREKLMRKKPVWQALAYSHEEDLASRLQLRREEAKLRGEEHRLRMQMMLGRVNRQPTLFERQSQVKFPKTREELIDELYKNFGGKKSPKCKLSDLSCLDMKDEAIQAMLDEYSSSNSRSNSKESESNEEKEKCECFSDENEKLT